MQDVFSQKVSPHDVVCQAAKALRGVGSALASSRHKKSPCFNPFSTEAKKACGLFISKVGMLHTARRWDQLRKQDKLTPQSPSTEGVADSRHHPPAPNCQRACKSTSFCRTGANSILMSKHGNPAVQLGAAVLTRTPEVKPTKPLPKVGFLTNLTLLESLFTARTLRTGEYPSTDHIVT